MIHTKIKSKGIAPKHIDMIALYINPTPNEEEEVEQGYIIDYIKTHLSNTQNTTLILGDLNTRG